MNILITEYVLVSTYYYAAIRLLIIYYYWCNYYTDISLIQNGTQVV